MLRLLFSFFLVTGYCSAQQMTGIELLNKAIAYHDPQGQWAYFKGDLKISLDAEHRPNRETYLSIDLYAQYFQMRTEKEGITLLQTVKKDTCRHLLDGSADLSEEIIAKYNLTDHRLRLLQDYYTYLYGLPMKLKDPGTIIDPVTQDIEFKGKTYKVLSVSYEKSVGSDTWLFYFDPVTYSMEVYQFFKQDPNNDGEYILLSGEEIISGIKMPKVRAWYNNKDDKHLGTDVLSSPQS